MRRDKIQLRLSFSASFYLLFMYEKQISNIHFFLLPYHLLHIALGFCSITSTVAHSPSP